MRSALLATVFSVIAANLAHAENGVVLPEIIVAAPAPATAGHQRCVDVTVGNDRSFGCLNEKMKQQVDKVSPVMNVEPIDAKSSDTKTGVVSIPGVQQQYGQNFGRSVVPYRPPPLVYTSPTGRH